MERDVIVLKKIIEYKRNLCYIPEENNCFKKCDEFIYKKEFSQKYHEFIAYSKRNKNIMTQAKIQPFCKKHEINLGIYDQKQKRILPLSVTERRICLYNQINHFCPIWKTKNTTFTDAIKELKNNFNYETNQNSDNVLKQVQEYKSPISNEKDCLFAVFFWYRNSQCRLSRILRTICSRCLPSSSTQRML